MKAMILAAGRGERMRPLTDHTPKPLLIAGGKPLIVHTIEHLVQAGITELVINHAHLGDQIEDSLGNGAAFGTTIQYSREAEALETAGGIIQALPLLGNQPFLAVNGDIATDYPFTRLKQIQLKLAHLILVINPYHNPNGDFVLTENGTLMAGGGSKLTFSGIGLYRPEFFQGYTPGKRKLLPLLLEAMAKGQVTGEFYQGFWLDVGTPQRLNDLDAYLQQSN